MNSSHKGQWREALMFTLICTRINGWVNNREVGDLRRHHGHYDVILMINKLICSIVLYIKYINPYWKLFYSSNRCIWILKSRWHSFTCAHLLKASVWKNNHSGAEPTRNILWDINQYKGCWLPGSLRRHAINSIAIRHITCSCLRLGMTANQIRHMVFLS